MACKDYGEMRANYFSGEACQRDLPWPFVLFVVVYLIAHPVYMVIRGGPEHLIELSSLLCKMGLLLLAKRVVTFNQGAIAVLAAFFTTSLFIVFLILKQKRMPAEMAKQQ
jgi:hypothetical protein